MLDDILAIFKTIQGKSVIYVVRNLLRYIIEGDGIQLVTHKSAFTLFRLFSLVQ
jgi:hypothetical protein